MTELVKEVIWEHYDDDHYDDFEKDALDLLKKNLSIYGSGNDLLVEIGLNGDKVTIPADSIILNGDLAFEFDVIYTMNRYFNTIESSLWDKYAQQIEQEYGITAKFSNANERETLVKFEYTDNEWSINWNSSDTTLKQTAKKVYDYAKKVLEIETGLIFEFIAQVKT